MTLAETLLPKLSDWRPTGGGRHSLSAAPDGWAVQVAADKADSLSCLVWELTLARTAAAPAGLALKDWAARIAARATGLMEPLRVVEVDDTRNEAVVRSTAPAARGDAVAYYEVHLHGLDKAVVRRYRASTNPGTRREQVAFAVTHEALAKLAGDIAA